MTSTASGRPGRLVLAYSGGSPETIERLERRFTGELITVTVDLGQGGGLEEIHDRALATGAARAHVLDAREEFAREYVLRALKAGVLRGDTLPIIRSLALAAVAKKAVEIAGLEHATSIAHGCTPGSQDERRFEASVAALAPGIKIVGVGRTAPAAPPDGGPDGRPAKENADARAASVELTFERGSPTAVNAVTMPLLDLFASLRTIAAAHGLGDSARHQRSRTLSSINFETPSLQLLEAAHEHLRHAVASESVQHFCDVAARQYAELLDHGQWYTPLREAIDAFFNKIEDRVTGAVRLELHNGHCRTMGWTSPNAGSKPGRSRAAAAPTAH